MANIPDDLRHELQFDAQSNDELQQILADVGYRTDLDELVSRFCGNAGTPRTAYYHRFSCTFRGTEKDLRPKAAEWPGLVDKRDYTFCNQLGAEAMQSGLAGLVTPSALHDGANLPVFRRDAVSDPELLDVATVTFDPNTGETTVR